MQGEAGRRRALAVLAAIAVAVPVPTLAQADAPKYRIGYLHPTDPADPGPAELRRALAALGYVAGRDVEFLEQYAHGKPDLLPALAAEIVARKPDIVVAVAPPAIRAAMGATKSIPIVMAFSGDDPVASGFVKSLSRPGGNVTGVTTVAHDFAPKWIELLREAVPGARRIAALRIPGAYAHDDQIDAMRRYAESRGMQLAVLDVRSPSEYEGAFARGVKERVDAVVLMSSPEFTANRERLAQLALASRLPSIFQYREYVAAGGLMSYGPDLGDLTARAAVYIDRILRGANPAEMPVEQPTKFVLAINRETAAALRLALPQSLLVRAAE
jgi:putative ABC transport system substrate-binding protein